MAAIGVVALSIEAGNKGGIDLPCPACPGCMVAAEEAAGRGACMLAVEGPHVLNHAQLRCKPPCWEALVGSKRGCSR